MKIEKNELLPHWLVLGVMLVMLVLGWLVCQHYGHFLGQPLPEAEREFIRSVLYLIAIITLPLINLIRHVQLRLNQTMPGGKPANSRYLLTIMISMILAESVGVLGFILFQLGDDYNTLYIFLGLAALGLYLYRPKDEEYLSIVEALEEQIRFEFEQRQ